MKKSALILLLVTSLSALPRLGVMEFDIKNSIGLDNAKLVLPDLLIPELEKAGKYQMEERLVLKSILDEQALALSGFIDEESAVEAGKLQGVEQILTGSAMKVGEVITLAGRVLSVQSGEILQSASVRFRKWSDLDESTAKLAWLLSGYSPAEYHAYRLEQKLQVRRYGLRLGSGYTRNRLEQWSEGLDGSWNLGSTWDEGISGTVVEVFYHHKRFDFEAGGVIPGHGSSMWTRLAIYPYTHWGFGSQYRAVDPTVNTEAGSLVGTFTYHAFLLGVHYRPWYNVRIQFYKGFSRVGELQHVTGNPSPVLDLDPGFNFFDSPTEVNVELLISDRLSVKGEYFHALENSKIIQDNAVLPGTLRYRQIHGLVRSYNLSLGYRFSY